MCESKGEILCFGFSYCASALARVLRPQGWRFAATCRDATRAKALQADGIRAVAFDDAIRDPQSALGDAAYILVSAPPARDGTDPIIAHFGTAIAEREKPFKWVGYLSTTSVYGDHKGAWIDEDTPVGAVSARGQRRLRAEAEWARICPRIDFFRLAGIYGPERNALVSLRNGTARRIVKSGQYFSRIHVDDIARVLSAAIDRADRKGVRHYAVCDDLPCPPEEVVRFAAELLDMPPPPPIDFDDAVAEGLLSPMAQSFYGESKRIRNKRIKEELGVVLRYPDYKAGLRALIDEPV